MGGPSLFVPAEVAKQARELIGQGGGGALGGGGGGGLRQGVELLLKSDLKLDSAGAGTSGGGAGTGGKGKGAVDAGEVLQRGLAALANSPFDALGIDLNAGTVDVRKAYKKMALKYREYLTPSLSHCLCGVVL